MRKKRIFGPKRSPFKVRLFTILLLLAFFSAFSFSAGLYVGRSESAADMSSHNAANARVSLPAHFSY